MIPFGWIQYKVEILSEKFKEDDVEIAPQTAVISFYNKNGQISGQLKKGYFSRDVIFKKILNKEPVILNSCYINNFSLSDFRQLNNLPKDEIIEIYSFSAVNSVFDALISNDFSYSRVINDSVSFKDSVFLQGNTNFQGAIFEKGNINLSHCHFVNGDFDFSQVDIGEGGAIFNGTVFGEGYKDFHYTKFGDRDVSFVAVQFGKGDVSFINAAFGDADISLLFSFYSFL